MDFSKYKYNPKDFEGIPTMPDALMAFYQALEAYKTEKSFLNRIFLKDKIEDIELALKHRMQNGMLTPALADEIDRYIGELIYNV